MLLGTDLATSPRRILAVDDDPTIQDILRFFLGDAYEVRLATTGAAAILTLRREKIDLVVLDHRLPDRTGLEILPDLKSICPHLPVVMLTGYGSEWICAAAFKLGVADYLQYSLSTHPACFTYCTNPTCESGVRHEKLREPVAVTGYFSDAM